ncbi:MAG: Gfo/Idh/MocA family oxidoreductase [Halobacteriovoraceae bacterium]|nr:Gfo/Idh/MocA family oxidoreductase [Halobacteriovoraceae bacterium]MCB9094059.1 Gfo/Idh/MocA family oxidoreductase [Halobacteriovoraceae bacterium]
MIKTALVGFGLSGKSFHAPFLKALEHFEVCCVQSSRTKEVQQYFPDAKIAKTFETVISDANIELVIITSPNHFHFSQCRQALEQGKHVLVEKPFVLDSKEGEELIALAEKRGLILSVFHNRRWDRDFLTLKELINNQTLGEVYLFESYFDRYKAHKKENWRDKKDFGGGILWDLGPHLIDQCLDLFGSPQSLYCDLGFQETNEVDDYFELHLHYPKTKVILRAGTYVQDNKTRLRVSGKNWGFTRDGLDNQEALLRSDVIPLTDTWNRELEKEKALLINSDEQKEIPLSECNYTDFYLLLAQAITENLPPPVYAREALNVIRIIELAKKSFQEKKVLELISITN